MRCFSHCKYTIFTKKIASLPTDLQTETWFGKIRNYIYLVAVAVTKCEYSRFASKMGNTYGAHQNQIPNEEQERFAAVRENECALTRRFNKTSIFTLALGRHARLGTNSHCKNLSDDLLERIGKFTMDQRILSLNVYDRIKRILWVYSVSFESEPAPKLEKILKLPVNNRTSRVTRVRYLGKGVFYVGTFCDTESSSDVMFCDTKLLFHDHNNSPVGISEVPETPFTVITKTLSSLYRIEYDFKSTNITKKFIFSGSGFDDGTRVGQVYWITRHGEHDTDVLKTKDGNVQEFLISDDERTPVAFSDNAMIVEEIYSVEIVNLNNGDLKNRFTIHHGGKILMCIRGGCIIVTNEIERIDKVWEPLLHIVTVHPSRGNHGLVIARVSGDRILVFYIPKIVRTRVNHDEVIVCGNLCFVFDCWESDDDDYIVEMKRKQHEPTGSHSTWKVYELVENGPSKYVGVFHMPHFANKEVTIQIW